MPEEDRAFATRLAKYCARDPVALEHFEPVSQAELAKCGEVAVLAPAVAVERRRRFPGDPATALADPARYRIRDADAQIAARRNTVVVTTAFFRGRVDAERASHTTLMEVSHRSMANLTCPPPQRSGSSSGGIPVPAPPAGSSHRIAWQRWYRPQNTIPPSLLSSSTRSPMDSVGSGWNRSCPRETANRVNAATRMGHGVEPIVRS